MKAIVAADLFCGAGGTSAGLIQACEALGRKVELTAINHWNVAIATHTANHPNVRHLCESLDNVDPRELFAGKDMDLLWASPECTHHSIARGGKPINDQSRATAWAVVRWAEALRPKAILVENVKEFQTWGPIGTNGRPLKSRMGEVFRSWVACLEAIGYTADWRVLKAADYGDPTTRERLFVQAVRGRKKIVWPEPTHARRGKTEDMFGTKQPWVPARDIIDWKIVGHSIFERDKPLAPKTLERIRFGLKKYGLKPFMAAYYGEKEGQATRIHGTDMPLPTVTAGGGRFGLATPFLIRMQGNESLESVDAPVSTVVAKQKHALVEPFLVKMFGTGTAQDVDGPVPTVTANGQHLGLCEPFLIKYYGNESGIESVDDPLDTVTTKERFGLVRPIVEIDGQKMMLDIRFRMLQPHELAAAQGFPPDYQFEGTKTDKVRQIGNAVPVGLARALCGAVLGEMAQQKAA